MSATTGAVLISLNKLPLAPCLIEGLKLIRVRPRKLSGCQIYGYRVMPYELQTHTFWAYGNFSNLEKISTNSFVANSYKLNIWTYGDLSNAPHGALVRDAREILPNLCFFSYLTALARPSATSSGMLS